jgi:hypothetical protein
MRAKLPSFVTRPTAAAALLVTLLAAGSAQAQLYGAMYRTAGQTAGIGPKLYDVDPNTGACTNPRSINVNFCVGIAIDPQPPHTMYGLTDQLGRINNVSGVGGKGLLFTINPATGQATAVGRVDPSSSSNDAPLAIFEGDIAFNPVTGQLWGVSQRVTGARLFTIDKATGLGTLTADVAPPAIVPVDPTTNSRTFDISAMAFGPQGDCYLLDTTYPTSPGPARLYRVEPTTGTVLDAWQTTRNLGNVAGIAFSPAGQLFVADGDTSSSQKLYKFNFATGDLEVVGNTNASGGTTIVYTGLAGLAFVPQAPAPACQADVTGDGTVDGSDFIAFINSFGIGDPTVDPAADVAGAGADGNSPDGTIDGSDFIAFINAFAIGC